MAMSANNRKNWRMVLVITITASIIGLVYAGLRMSLDLMPRTMMEIEHAIRSAAFLGFCLSILLFFVIYAEKGVKIRRLGFVSGWLLTNVLATMVIAFAILTQRLVTALIYGNITYFTLYFSDSIVADITIAFVVFLIIVFILQMRRLVGEGTMWKVLTGRYHQPQEENRVFMFLDIKGSTAIAEQLGDKKAHALITEVFFYADRKISDHGGEILSYNGDEIVATWPQDSGAKDGRCLNCYREIVDDLNARAKHYEEKYSQRPDLWAGLHCGPVVVGECGDSKMAIVYIGDTPNTAARLEQLSKTVGQNCLVSEAMASMLPEIPGISLSPIEPTILRGHSHETKIFAVTLAPMPA
jgi:adenylate cyclase